jgi:hypothetical protein
MAEITYTDLERARLDACAARRVAYQAQAQALELMARENNAAEQAIITAATQRSEAQAANGAQDGADNADVVTLHRDGVRPAAA